MRRLLSPGLFVRVRLPLGTPHQAVIVPERALGSDQGQKFLYVVGTEITHGPADEHRARGEMGVTEGAAGG